MLHFLLLLALNPVKQTDQAGSPEQLHLLQRARKKAAVQGGHGRGPVHLATRINTVRHASERDNVLNYLATYMGRSSPNKLPILFAIFHHEF